MQTRTLGTGGLEVSTLGFGCMGSATDTVTPSIREGVAPFRDQIVLATKLGWNIDLETGERRPGLNSRPEHIKLVVEGLRDGPEHSSPSPRRVRGSRCIRRENMDGSAREMSKPETSP